MPVERICAMLLDEMVLNENGLGMGVIIVLVKGENVTLLECNNSECLTKRVSPGFFYMTEVSLCFFYIKTCLIDFLQGKMHQDVD